MPESHLALLEALRNAVGHRHVLTDFAQMQPYLTDWRGRYTGKALCVIRPATTDELACVVKHCATAGVALVPQGGNTGLVGGGVPVPDNQTSRPQALISLTRLNRIRAIDTENNTMTVDAGCVLQQVQEAAARVGRLFPLSLASEGSATIGGNLSTNAGGVQVFRYGTMRDLTLGLEVVLADGQTWHGLRGLRKDNTGYDLKHLFIGAEGTLGIITGAVLKLYPQPQDHVTAWVTVASPQAAVDLLGRLRQTCGERVTAFEIINRAALELVLRHIPDTRAPLQHVDAWQILLELSDFRDSRDVLESASLADRLSEILTAEIENQHVQEAVLARNDSEAKSLWKLRESISEAQKMEGLSIKHDVSLPISMIASFIEQAGQQLGVAYPGLRIVCFGHLGDGNLHYNPSQPVSEDNARFMAATPAVNRCVHDLVHACGGSISAEHGLGQLKRDEIMRYKSAVEMQLMQSLKQTLDPDGLMNPGKVIQSLSR